jgi:hypothetical protein
MVGDDAISVGVAATLIVAVGVGTGGGLLSQAISKKRLASKARLVILLDLLIVCILSWRDVVWRRDLCPGKYKAEMYRESDLPILVILSAAKNLVPRLSVGVRQGERTRAREYARIEILRCAQNDKG